LPHLRGKNAYASSPHQKSVQKFMKAPAEESKMIFKGQDGPVAFYEAIDAFNKEIKLLA